MNRVAYLNRPYGAMLTMGDLRLAEELQAQAKDEATHAPIDLRAGNFSRVPIDGEPVASYFDRPEQTYTQRAARSRKSAQHPNSKAARARQSAAVKPWKRTR